MDQIKEEWRGDGIVWPRWLTFSRGGFWLEFNEYQVDMYTLEGARELARRWFEDLSDDIDQIDRTC